MIDSLRSPARRLGGIAIVAASIIAATATCSGGEKSLAPPVAAALELEGGDGQSAAAGSQLSDLLSVRVVDASGAPVSGVTIAWHVMSGGGAVSPLSTMTGATGIARASFRLGRKAGPCTVTAGIATDSSIAPVTFSAVALVGLAAVLVFSVGPTTESAGSPFAPALQVTVQDSVGNQVTTSEDAVTVALGSAPPGGALSGTRTVAASGGVATFPDLRIDKAGAGYTLTASATGMVTATSAAFAVVPGPAAQVAAAAGNGQSAAAGSAVAVPPSVIVRDAVGNPVSGTSVTFAVTGGGGTVAPAGAVTTDASGVAQVTSWTLGTALGTNTLTATAPGLAGSPVTFTATGTTGPPTQIAANSATAQNGIPGSAVAVLPSVVVRDANNNPVSGVAVTFAVTFGGGTVVPAAPVTTNASGIAQVTSWTLGTFVGLQSLAATAAGLAGSPVTFTANAYLPPPPQILVNGGNNQSATAGTAVAVPPSVVVRDYQGNGVGGLAVTFVVTGGGGTVVPTTAVTTNASGIAQVTSWTLGPTAGTNSLVATSPGAASTATFTATGTTGSAAQIAVNSGDNQSATAGAAVAAAPSVLVTDAHGNPVSGVAVTFAVATGGGSVVPTTAVATNASGIAQVTSWTLSTTAGSNTLTATSAGLTGSPVTFTATGTAGSATQIAINGGNGQSATAGSAVAVAPSVRITDSHGNPVSGVGVTFAVATGGGTVSPTTAVATNAGGIPQVTSWTLGTVAGPNTLTATSSGLTGSPLTFTATGNSGSATQMTVNAGNGQTA
ncbi:MAG TPA: Ig-like domain-containing protein, partial [Gemmatimonadales bacterium]|nr:Ig-like domain-containing protein [Gemmatimonadales bacterium]